MQNPTGVGFPSRYPGRRSPPRTSEDVRELDSKHRLPRTRGSESAYRRGVTRTRLPPLTAVPCRAAELFWSLLPGNRTTSVPASAGVVRQRRSGQSSPVLDRWESKRWWLNSRGEKAETELLSGAVLW